MIPKVQNICQPFLNEFLFFGIFFKIKEVLPRCAEGTYEQNFAVLHTIKSKTQVFTAKRIALQSLCRTAKDLLLIIFNSQ